MGPLTRFVLVIMLVLCATLPGVRAQENVPEIDAFFQNFYKPYRGRVHPNLYTPSWYKYFTNSFADAYRKAAACRFLADDPFIGGTTPARLASISVQRVKDVEGGVWAFLRLTEQGGDGDTWQVVYRLVNESGRWLIDDVSPAQEGWRKHDLAPTKEDCALSRSINP